MFSRLLSLILLITISPLMIIISIIIFLDDGFPIFFTQKRSGINNSFFLIYKFRTMLRNTPDIPTNSLVSSKSLYIRSGQFLRKYSLDEIPQLINVLKGEINFIGPRPALHNQDDLIKLRKNLGINNIKPGITGYSQINGRDNLSIEKKVELDNYYYKNRSFKLNLKIILKTLFQVFFPKNVSN